MTDPEERLRNLGPVSLRWLSEIGIGTVADLEKTGSVDAYCRVKAMGHAPSLNLLYALEGALLDLDWRKLPSEVKAELKDAAGRIG